jgi:hypothetical protein
LPVSPFGRRFWGLGTGRGIVAAALIDPTVFVVFFVIHHLQNENDSGPVVYAANEPDTIVSNVEHNAVANLVSRTERLLERTKVLPSSGFCWSKPRFQISLGLPPVMFSGLPKFSQRCLLDDPHSNSNVGLSPFDDSVANQA